MKLRDIALWVAFFLVFSSSVRAEPGGILEAGWSADGRYLVTTGEGRRIRVHDGETGLVLKAAQAPGELTTYFSFGPDSGWDVPNPLSALSVSGETAVVGSEDFALYWWSLPDLTVTSTGEVTYHQCGITASNDGNSVLCLSTSTRYLDSALQYFRRSSEGLSDNGLPDLPPPDSSDSYGSLRLSPDGHWAAAWTGSSHQLWDLSQEGTPSRTLADMRSIVLGNSRLYEISLASVLIHPYDSPEATERALTCREIEDVAVDQQEHRLVNLTAEGLEIWDLTSQAEPDFWAQPGDRMKLSPDGRKVALWTDGKLLVADLDTHKVLYKLPLTGKLKESK